MKKNKKRKFWPAFWITLWLLFSAAGTVLFAFGLNDWFKARTFDNFYPVIIGAVIVFVAIYLGQFRTETSVAMRRK